MKLRSCKGMGRSRLAKCGVPVFKLSELSIDPAETKINISPAHNQGILITFKTSTQLYKGDIIKIKIYGEDGSGIWKYSKEGGPSSTKRVRYDGSANTGWWMANKVFKAGRKDPSLYAAQHFVVNDTLQGKTQDIGNLRGEKCNIFPFRVMIGHKPITERGGTYYLTTKYNSFLDIDTINNYTPGIAPSASEYYEKLKEEQLNLGTTFNVLESWGISFLASQGSNSGVEQEEEDPPAPGTTPPPSPTSLFISEIMTQGTNGPPPANMPGIWSLKPPRSKISAQNENIFLTYGNSTSYPETETTVTFKIKQRFIRKNTKINILFGPELQGRDVVLKTLHTFLNKNEVGFKYYWDLFVSRHKPEKNLRAWVTTEEKTGTLQNDLPMNQYCYDDGDFVTPGGGLAVGPVAVGPVSPPALLPS